MNGWKNRCNNSRDLFTLRSIWMFLTLLLCYLKKVFQHKNVVGFDIVELAPIPELKAPDFLVAKLYYKMLSYKFKYHGK